MTNCTEPSLKQLPDILTIQRQRLISRYLSQSKGIMHLGAHVGQEREKYSQLGKRVLWVEGHPEIFLKLQQNIANFSEQRALCAVLADVDGQQSTFFRSNNSDGVSSSLFAFGEYGDGEQSLWPNLGLQMIEQLSLPTLRLDTLLDGNTIKAEDYTFWVVDLQGAEGLALEGGKSSLIFCEAILIEVSTVSVYRGGVQWSQLQKQLARLGFVPLWEPARPHDDVLFVRRSESYCPRIAFQSVEYLRIDQRRLEHLASLDLNLCDQTVLEVGAGIGSHTSFYLDRRCKVMATEGRIENVEILRERYRNEDKVEVVRLDLSDPQSLQRHFELVHCYDLLYHMEQPALVLAYLAKHCSGQLLLETCLSFGDDPAVNLVEEVASNSTQAMGGLGCRPTRSWVWDQLNTHFPFVYTTRTQPFHEQFPLNWHDAKTFKSGKLSRAIFIASHVPLNNRNLLPYLPPIYE